MNDLLANPAFQAGVFPFCAALIFTVLTGRLSYWSGLAILAGFITVILLTTGIQFSPLTSTRKIVIMALLFPAIGTLFHLARFDNRQSNITLIIVGTLSIFWIIWPYISRQEINEALMIGVLSAIYVVWMLVVSASHTSSTVISAGSSAVAMGFGIGGTAIIGASALLGQIGIAIGASGGAYLLVHLILKTRRNAGYLIGICAGGISGLLGVTSVLYAKVPWYALLILAPIPLLTKISLPDRQSPWLQAVIWISICMLPAGLAMYLTSNSAGPALY